MKNIIFLVLLTVPFCFSCKKDDDNDTTPYQVDVSGFTRTDMSGAILGQIDNSDWTSDASWSTQETALLETPTNAMLVDASAGTIQVFPAYPNPLSAPFILACNSSTRCLLQVVITDNLLNIKLREWRQVDADANPFMIIPDAAQLTNNTNYRVYYAFYNGAGDVFYRGHGDVRVER